MSSEVEPVEELSLPASVLAIAAFPALVLYEAFVVRQLLLWFVAPLVEFATPGVFHIAGLLVLYSLVFGRHRKSETPLQDMAFAALGGSVSLALGFLFSFGV